MTDTPDNFVDLMDSGDEILTLIRSESKLYSNALGLMMLGEDGRPMPEDAKAELVISTADGGFSRVPIDLNQLVDGNEQMKTALKIMVSNHVKTMRCQAEDLKKVAEAMLGLLGPNPEDQPGEATE